MQNRILKFDKSIFYQPQKKLTFKQIRDIGFSKEKSLHNPIFCAHIAPNGKSPVPVGIYFFNTGNRDFLNCALGNFKMPEKNEISDTKVLYYNIG